jgi:hypothetical protein
MRSGWGGGLSLVILAIQEAVIRRITVLGQPRLKSSRDPIKTSKSWVWRDMPVILVAREA